MGIFLFSYLNHDQACPLYFSQKQLPRKMMKRLVIICTVRGLYFLAVVFVRSSVGFRFTL